MKWIARMAAVAVLPLCFTGPAQAQGPAGAGAGKAAASDTTTGAHSFNPIKWVKRDSKTADDELNGDAVRNEKLTARLHDQGLLPAKTEARDACTNFKELSDCVAALRASRKLGIDFECVKVDMTHVHSATDPASCRRPEKDEAIGLAQAIRLLKPGADAKGEARDAERAAKEDLKAAR